MINIMREWDVYINGKWHGTVIEDSEANARNAAASKYASDRPTASISVSAR